MQEKFSILIVEDDLPIRTLLTEVLSPRFHCLGVSSAVEALGLLESRFFHVALVDIGLPGMSGLGLCRLIVKGSPQTAVIVVSGNSDDQTISDALTAGAVDYLKKPFNLGHAVSVVEKALNQDLPNAVA